MIRVGIVGSRSKDTPADKGRIRQVLKAQLKQGKKLHLVSGGCYKGADKFAEELALELNLGITVYPVDIEAGAPRWEYAARAHARNTLIAESCDLLIACWDGASSGTKDTVNKVKILKKPLIIL